MKKQIILAMVAVSFLFASAEAKTDDTTKVVLLKKGEAKDACDICGMKLSKYYKTNHAAVIDGVQEQFCSIHDLVEAMRRSHKKVENIQVVDNTTLKFIPARKAWYVVGSSQPAVMSKVSKYAFGTKKAAQEFAKKYGGEVVTFKEALEEAQEDFK